MLWLSFGQCVMVATSAAADLARIQFNHRLPKIIRNGARPTPEPQWWTTQRQDLGCHRTLFSRCWCPLLRGCTSDVQESADWEKANLRRSVPAQSTLCHLLQLFKMHCVFWTVASFWKLHQELLDAAS